MSDKAFTVDLIDVSRAGYALQLTATSLQGIVNRKSPRIFLDYGIYDDPESRRTNEVFLPDDIWKSKYRDAIGKTDLNNLEYYKSIYNLEVEGPCSVETAVLKYAGNFKGAVVWDPEFPDTANIALMMSGLDDLVVIDPDSIEWIKRKTSLVIKKDLRKRWTSTVSLYRWAFENLFPRCAEGRVACIEPGWTRPEFTDFIVKNRIFVYSLATLDSGMLFSLGQKLLLLLVAGPFRLRNLFFTFHLDKLIKRIGLFLMGLGSEETKLASSIQRAVKATPFPTIFGWHTLRDDEFSFMLHLSSNGLRLIPSHLATNFSFHSDLPAMVDCKQDHASYDSVNLENDKIYLTFTLSDGDQLLLMNTAELGNWRRQERGMVPFNWETQPLLVDIAPALLGYYYKNLLPSDYLIAGPSGAGYIVPPLVSNLRAYLKESAEVCSRAGIKVLTSYIGDPPTKVVREHLKASDNFLGFLGGYVNFGRTPGYTSKKRAFVANSWPPLDNVSDSADDTLAGVKKLLDEPGPTPRFIGVHLFAYRTTITDVYHFVETLNTKKVKVVKADEFLLAAARHLENSKGEIRT